MLVEASNITGGGISSSPEAVDTLAIGSVMPRGDQLSSSGAEAKKPFHLRIKDEAESATGTRFADELEVFSTPAASPHTTELQDSSKVQVELANVYGNPSRLTTDQSPLHLVGWMLNGGEPIDFGDPGRWPSETRQAASELQAQEMLLGAISLHCLSGGRWPTLWQAMGHNSGRNPLYARGGPSNPNHHFHEVITDSIEPGSDRVIETTTDIDVIASLLAPVDGAIHDRLGSQMSKIFQHMLGGARAGWDVSLATDNLSVYYQATNEHEVPLADFLERVMAGSCQLDTMYQKILLYHRAEYEAKCGDKDSAGSAEILGAEIMSDAAGVGLDDNDMQQVLDFSETIRPTHQQLLHWRQQGLRGERLDADLRLREKMIKKDRPTSRLATKIMTDASLSEGHGATSLSARPSFCYMIRPDAYRISPGSPGEIVLRTGRAVTFATCFGTTRTAMDVLAQAKLVRV